MLNLLIHSSACLIDPGPMGPPCGTEKKRPPHLQAGQNLPAPAHPCLPARRGAGRHTPLTRAGKLPAQTPGADAPIPLRSQLCAQRLQGRPLVSAQWIGARGKKPQFPSLLLCRGSGDPTGGSREMGQRGFRMADIQHHGPASGARLRPNLPPRHPAILRQIQHAFRFMVGREINHRLAARDSLEKSAQLCRGGPGADLSPPPIRRHQPGAGMPATQWLAPGVTFGHPGVE